MDHLSSIDPVESFNKNINNHYDSNISQLMDKIISLKHVDSDKVYSLCTKLYDYALKNHDSYLESFSLLYFSISCIGNSKIKESIEYGLKGYALQKSNNYLTLLPHQANILGCSFSYKGDVQTAMNYFHEGIKFAKNANDSYMLAALYANNSNMYRDNGAYKDALVLLQSAFDTLDQAKKNTYHVALYPIAMYLDHLELNFHLKDQKETDSYFNTVSLLINEKDNMKYYGYRYFSLKAQILYSKQNPISSIIDTLKSAFACFKDLPISEYSCCYFSFKNAFILLIELINLIRSDNICVLSYDDVFQIGIDGLATFQKIVTYMDLSYLWIIFDNIKIRFFECILQIPSSIIDYQKYHEELASTYCHFYEQCSLRDEEINKQLNLQLIDIISLYEAQYENQKNRLKAVQLKLESEQDALTGCSNRYGLDNFLQTYFKYTKDSEKNFCCIIFDVDYFKQYNDTYGHLAGDTCLIAVSRIIKEAQNEEGFLVRYGGDEFVILYIDKTDQEIIEIVDNIRSKLYEENIHHASSMVSDRVTLTMGIINQIPKGDISSKEFIHAADEALYEVKKVSRNNYLFSKKYSD